jgi:hypothetical protein
MSSTTSSGLPVNDILRTQSSEDHGIAGSFLGKYYMRIAIGKYERPVPFGVPKQKPSFYIFLPLPRSLADVTSVGYSDQNLTSVGDFVNNATGSASAAILGQAGNLISATGSIGATAAASAAERTKTVPGVVGAAGIKALAEGMRTIFPAEAMTSAVQQEAGIAPNPNPSVAFTGPILRTFNYDWSLYPKNKKESLAIQRMIRLLKRSALPRNAIGKSAAILSYPDVCQLNFYPWDRGGGGEWGWKNATNTSAGSIIKYKKCIMQSVNVSYSAGGGSLAFFEGTNLPTSYELQIEFKEIEYMLSEDWSDTTLPAGITDEAPFIERQLTDVTSRVSQGVSEITSSGIPAVAAVVAGLGSGPFRAVGENVGPVAVNLYTQGTV